jgi:hypothetical protein
VWRRLLCRQRGRMRKGAWRVGRVRLWKSSGCVAGTWKSECKGILGVFVDWKEVNHYIIICFGIVGEASIGRLCQEIPETSECLPIRLDSIYLRPMNTAMTRGASFSGAFRVSVARGFVLPGGPSQAPKQHTIPFKSNLLIPNDQPPCSSPPPSGTPQSLSSPLRLAILRSAKVRGPTPQTDRPSLFASFRD